MPRYHIEDNFNVDGPLHLSPIEIINPLPNVSGDIFGEFETSPNLGSWASDQALASVKSGGRAYFYDSLAAPASLYYNFNGSAFNNAPRRENYPTEEAWDEALQAYVRDLFFHRGPPQRFGPSNCFNLLSGVQFPEITEDGRSSIVSAHGYLESISYTTVQNPPFEEIEFIYNDIDVAGGRDLRQSLFDDPATADFGALFISKIDFTVRCVTEDEPDCLAVSLLYDGSQIRPVTFSGVDPSIDVTPSLDPSTNRITSAAILGGDFVDEEFVVGSGFGVSDGTQTLTMDLRSLYEDFSYDSRSLNVNWQSGHSDATYELVSVKIYYRKI